MKKDFDPRVFMTGVRLEAGEPLTGGITRQLLMRLLRMRGESFVSQAYRVFLGRNADASAYEGYGKMAESLAGRMFLLMALALSPERRVLPPALLKILRGLGRAGRRIFPH